MSNLKTSRLAAALVLATSAAFAQTYYVDFGRTTDTPSGLSTGNVLNVSSDASYAAASTVNIGNLINFSTGASSSITASLLVGAVGLDVNSGTDGSAVKAGFAATYFAPTEVNLDGFIGQASGSATLTFSGLDFSNFTYELSFYGNRNGTGGTASRITNFTISDVDAFTNVTDTTGGTSVGATGGVVMGENAAGNVARFTGINPGTDNDLVVTFSSGSAARWYVGGFNLTATPIPEPSTYAALAGVALLGFAAFRRRR
jgi:hypothetical protein